MTLVIGYGNPGRGDDGLGPALAEALRAAALPGVDVRVDYQLTVDHALEIAGADRVVFADAMIGGEAPYRFSPVRAATGADLTSHSLSPQTVLALAETLFGAAPEAHVLGIAGVAFGEVHEGLSAEAAHNLEAARQFMAGWLGAEALADA